jgi:hypothetical protein
MYYIHNITVLLAPSSKTDILPANFVSACLVDTVHFPFYLDTFERFVKYMLNYPFAPRPAAYYSISGVRVASGIKYPVFLS